MWRGLSFEGLVSIAVPGQNLNPVQKDSLVYVASSQFRRPGQHSWARPKPQPSIKTLSRICGEASVSKGLVNVAGAWNQSWPQYKKTLSYMCGGCICRKAPWLERLSPVSGAGHGTTAVPSTKRLSRICGEASVSKGLVNVAGAWNQSWPQYKKTLSYMCGGCICRRAPWLERLSPVSGAGLITRAMLPGQATAERFVFEFAKPAKPMKSKPSTFQNQ